MVVGPGLCRIPYLDFPSALTGTQRQATDLAHRETRNGRHTASLPSPKRLRRFGSTDDKFLPYPPGNRDDHLCLSRIPERMPYGKELLSGQSA